MGSPKRYLASSLHALDLLEQVGIGILHGISEGRRLEVEWRGLAVSTGRSWQRLVLCVRRGRRKQRRLLAAIFFASRTSEILYFMHAGFFGL